MNEGRKVPKWTEREDAHLFYISLGFQSKSTGFVKTLL